MKNEVFSLPYEQIGCEIISIFNNNFKTIERFLDKLVNFDICKYIIDFLSKEFYEYDQLFKKIEKFNDLRQFLGHNKK